MLLRNSEFLHFPLFLLLENPSLTNTLLCPFKSFKIPLFSLWYKGWWSTLFCIETSFWPSSDWNFFFSSFLLFIPYMHMLPFSFTAPSLKTSGTSDHFFLKVWGFFVRYSIFFTWVEIILYNKRASWDSMIRFFPS